MSISLKKHKLSATLSLFLLKENVKPFYNGYQNSVIIPNFVSKYLQSKLPEIAQNYFDQLDSQKINYLINNLNDASIDIVQNIYDVFLRKHKITDIKYIKIPQEFQININLDDHLAYSDPSFLMLVFLKRIESLFFRFKQNGVNITSNSNIADLLSQLQTNVNTLLQNTNFCITGCEDSSCMIDNAFFTSFASYLVSVSEETAVEQLRNLFEYINVINIYEMQIQLELN